MDHPHHLHSQERVLYWTRQSRGALVGSIVQGTWQGAIAGVFLGGLGFAGMLMNGAEGGALLFGVLFVLGLAGFIARHMYMWKHTTLTITTQRILLESYEIWLGNGHEQFHYKSLLHDSMQTIRWDQYQESTCEAGLAGKMGNSGALTIRYGSADSYRTATLRAVPFASDLKHYLDKLHALKTTNVPAEQWPTFIPAKRGKRGE